jgi:hypothetical protein
VVEALHVETLHATSLRMGAHVPACIARRNFDAGRRRMWITPGKGAERPQPGVGRGDSETARRTASYDVMMMFRAVKTEKGERRKGERFFSVLRSPLTVNRRALRALSSPANRGRSVSQQMSPRAPCGRLVDMTMLFWGERAAGRRRSRPPAAAISNATPACRSEHVSACEAETPVVHLPHSAKE